MQGGGPKGVRSYGKSIGAALVAIAIIAAGLGVYYYYHGRAAKAPISTGEPAGKQISPQLGEKRVPGKEAQVMPLPALRDSDEWLRKKLRDLSSSSRFADWLKIDELIRRITAAVDNIAHGMSPRAHLKFMIPNKSFTVVKKGEELYINPQSYRRYDLIADAFSSLDAKGAAWIFREAKPVFQEAYRELGYPDQDFQETLIQAVKELLGTPIVKGNIIVVQGVTTYQMLDDNLEDLDDAQKDLLRMGPQNMRKVQDKLREIALALEVPENQLPKPRVYAVKP
jgi:hypothetical protein